MSSGHSRKVQPRSNVSRACNWAMLLASLTRGVPFAFASFRKAAKHGPRRGASIGGSSVWRRSNGAKRCGRAKHINC